MNKYARIDFGPDDAEKKRQILNTLNGTQIITVAKEDIDRWYEEDVRIKLPETYRIALHNKEECERFESLMKAFFPEVEYEITNESKNDPFKKWVEKNSSRNKHAVK